MAVKCLNCGAKNADDAKLCQSCASALVPSDELPPVTVQPGPTRRSRTSILVAAIVIAAILILSAVALRYLTTRKADLWADLSFETSNADMLGNPTMGVIAVFGQIYNDGDEAGNGTLFLHIYDGYEWHNYSEPTGEVPANGHVDFLWAEIFDPMNEDEVVVEYEVTME